MKPISLQSALNELSRRDFLRTLCGLAGAVVLTPSWTLADTAGQPVNVPPTLMLHSRDEYKIGGILRWLTDNGYTGLTYATLASALRGETRLPQRPVIITLDDVDTVYVAPYFIKMIDMIEKAGYTGVLGVITSRSQKENPASWLTLAELAGRGWEIDTHTSHHVLLPSLKLAAQHEEIVGSASMISDALGQPPTCLIVPFANMHTPNGKLDQHIFDLSKEANLEFVVGMAGGRHLVPDSIPPYYVGRIGPGRDAIQTGRWLAAFNTDKSDAP